MEKKRYFLGLTNNAGPKEQSQAEKPKNPADSAMELTLVRFNQDVAASASLRQLADRIGFYADKGAVFYRQGKDNEQTIVDLNEQKSILENIMESFAKQRYEEIEEGLTKLTDKCGGIRTKARGFYLKLKSTVTNQ